VKVMRLVLVKPAMNGLLSTAPKYVMPMMVVNQSIVPIRTKAKLGTALALSMVASSFPFSTMLNAVWLFK
jgi:hypothetical protein